MRKIKEKEEEKEKTEAQEIVLSEQTPPALAQDSIMEYIKKETIKLAEQLVRMMDNK